MDDVNWPSVIKGQRNCDNAEVVCKDLFCPVTCPDLLGRHHQMTDVVPVEVKEPVSDGSGALS